jgi:hypothetical protein
MEAPLQTSKTDDARLVAHPPLVVSQVFYKTKKFLLKNQ